MSKIFLFWLLFCLASSCRQASAPAPKEPSSTSEETRRFYDIFNPDWLAAFDVVILNEHFINTEEYIIGPEKTWQKLLRIDFLTQGSGHFEKSSHCLFYKLPAGPVSQKKERSRFFGELKAVPLFLGEKCEEVLARESIHSIRNVVNLSISINGHKSGHPQLRPYHLTFNFEFYDQRQKKYLNSSLDFPLFNVIQGHLKLDKKNKVMGTSRNHQRYSSNVQQRLNPGLTLFAIKEKNRPIRPSSERPSFLGRLDDTYADGTLIKCHDVNDDCETIQEFTCDQCRFGWFEAVGSECPTGGAKYCGISHCGRSKELACQRGGELARNKGMLHCQNESLAGFCQNNDATFCDENHLLICP